MVFCVGLMFGCRRTIKKLTQLGACYSRKAVYIYPKTEDDYSAVPEYPPIEPVDEEYLKQKEIKAWYDKIKRQKTVEEKLFEINVPRYWGWKCLFLKEGEIPYNSLDFTRFITRTHLIETDELPGLYKDSSMKCWELTQHIKSKVWDLIVENQCQREKCIFQNSDKLDSDSEFSRKIIDELNRLILKNLQQYNVDCQSVQVDYSPRIEASWYFGSLTETYIPENYDSGLKHEEIPEEYIGRPSDKYIQYVGKPIIQLRIQNPLPPVMNLAEALYLQYPVGIYEYDPFVVFDYEMVRRHVTNIPGFWPGESREFSLLSYHDTSHLKFRPGTYGCDDPKEAVHCQAILASFAWLMSLSNYQGFTTFHDVTYPFVTQTILTNGREFSFAVFQLNTTELYHKDPFHNPKCNICWITPKMHLYKIVDGECKDFNENVIKLLLQFYTNSPEDLKNCVRKPYLGDKIQTIANYEDEEKRTWLETSFKYFSSNRPRHRVDKMYEPADYERIFKIQYQKIVTDPRRRPFELLQNPYHRKMSDHLPEYIPRKLRPDGDLPKYKQQKFRKTYYPE